MTHILIVDDKSENRYYLEALLTGHGYQVATAQHGAEALVRARSAPPDLVISDLLMPVMDGYTLLRHWKSDPRLSKVPFVVYTATYTEPEDERLARSLGADDFILKPAEPDAFLERIRAVEARATAGAPAHAPRTLEDEPDLLNVYSQTLVRKLEEKTFQLEETNRTLHGEVAERRTMADIQTAILDALPAHIALVNAAGRILAVNESWRRFSVANVLRSPGYGVGTNYLEVCERAAGDCADEAGAAAQGIRRVLSGDLDQFALEYPCHGPDERRWFRLMVTPLQAHGQAGAVVMHLNVTERRVAQDALERSLAEQRDLAVRLEAQRARLAEAQAVANVGSWETDLGTGTVAWSDETHRIFGTDASQFHPTHPAFLACVHPDDRARVDAAFVTSLATETDHAIEHRVILPDGRVRFVQERWRVTRDHSGAPIRAAGTCQDITDRKQAEETLRESEERFRQLAETISEVFWITDTAKTRIIYVSPAYEAIWGRGREDLYAHPETWLDAIHADDRDVVRQALPAQREGEYDVTYRVVRPDGSLRWVRDRAFPVRDTTGAVYRMVGLAEDITERKAIEAQFLRAQRMESIGTLAGGIAHDLNNVLTPILMSVELLKEDDTPDGRRQTIETIEASARKGAEMIRQVLTFARGVEGRRVEVDVAALLRDVERIVNDTFLKTIAMTATTQDGLPAVLGDSTQLHQVLLNLCVNARDAMPGGGAIAVTARQQRVDEAYASTHTDARPGVFVAIGVADTGTGMAPDVIERIFEPFYSTKEPGKGTGLGLSTSLAIVKSHGGFFHVDSTPGAGSTFVFYLPVARASAREPGGSSEPDIRRGRGELILVVDDEPRIRDITRRMLEAFGYRVLLAADGAEAVAVFTARQPEIAAVLTDMMMPVMDGAATIHAMRALSPTVPIVAVSGMAHGHEPPADRAGGSRHTRHLPKPYTTEELLRVIDAALHEPA